MNNLLKIIFLILLVFLPLISFISFFQYLSVEYFFQEIRKIYILKSLKFSFLQASISSFISVLGGVFVARALFYLNINKIVLHFLYVICVIPSLIVIFGLISFYGNGGFIQKFINFRFYGLNGILLAHIFLNLPFASLLLLKSLQNIPYNYHELNLIFNIHKWSLFKNVEFLYFKEQIIQAFVLIFILCFSSFTIILTLGANPRYSTLEVLIYHALHGQYNFFKVSVLSVLQILIGCFLSSIFYILNKKKEEVYKVSYFSYNFQYKNFFHYIVIFLLFIFLTPPILSVFFESLFHLNQVDWYLLFIASLQSLLLAFLVGLISLVISYFLIKINFMINFVSILFFIFPLIVFCSGLNLLFSPGKYLSIFFLIIVNSLILIPYCLRFLKESLNNLRKKYNNLISAFDICGFNYFYFIEWKALKSNFFNTFSFILVLALGDFTVIISFPNSDVLTLPLYLSQQLGSYRIDQASCTALVLLILSLIIFRVFYDKSK